MNLLLCILKRRPKLFGGETERCDLANTELEFMKLPGALGEFKSKNTLDELAAPTLEVYEWANSIQDEEIHKTSINDLK
jgi:hypothetical protein